MSNFKIGFMINSTSTKKKTIKYAPFGYERIVGMVLFNKIVIRFKCPIILQHFFGVP
jgi:hypothetical protein